MKSIYTLVSDIQHYITTNEDWYDKVSEDFVSQSRNRLNNRTGDTNNKKGTLRLSGLADRCPKALWYSIHHPDQAQQLPPDAQFKYGYGHIIEIMTLSLARLSGHTVEGEQDELRVDGVVGHRDAVIDGCVVDVKSCSSIAFSKYKDGTFSEATDDFGYLYQLDGYVLGSSMDAIVTVKDKGYILAIDKQMGHMALYEHRIRPERIRSRIAYYKYIAERPTAPICECGTIQSKTVGETVLNTRASYSAYKHICFPNLKTLMIKGRPYYVPERNHGTDMERTSFNGTIAQS
jgi:hypothetical protein